MKLIEGEINTILKVFSENRKKTLDEIIPEFIKINDTIGKKIKKGEYILPTSITLAEINSPQCNVPELGFAEKFNQAAPLINAGSQGLNYFLQEYCKKMGRTPAYQPNDNGLALMLKGIAALANFVYAKNAQNEAEETAVRKYEKEVNIQIGIVDDRISALRAGLIPRINELIFVTKELHERCLKSLVELKNNMNTQFDFDNDELIRSYETAKTLVMQASKLAKLRILDENNKLSEYDTKFLIEYKKI